MQNIDQCITIQSSIELKNNIQKVHKILAFFHDYIIKKNANDDVQKKNFDLFQKFKIKIDDQCLQKLYIQLKNTTNINKNEKYFKQIRQLKKSISVQGCDFSSPYEWLWGDQIQNVLTRQQIKHKNYRFLCTIFKDFNEHAYLEDEVNSMKEMHGQGYKQFGIIQNLSNIGESGNHWVSIFINFDLQLLVYFDSSGKNPDEYNVSQKEQHYIADLDDVQMKEYIQNSDFKINAIWYFIVSFLKKGINFDIQDKDIYLKQFAPKIKKDFLILENGSNGVKVFINNKNHQKIDGQCGMYSIMSILYFLECTNIQQIMSINDKILTDGSMSKLRRHVFSNIKQLEDQKLKEKMKGIQNKHFQ